MRQWFISDLHLSADTPTLVEGLSKLIALTDDVDQLYILGDLFDAWIGDDHGLAPLTQLEQLLASVAHHGCELFLMPGNRDFLMGEALAKRCNATLLPDPIVLDTPRGRVLFAHGDAYCTDDHAHMEFRAMSRTPEWQAQVLALPVSERLKLASSIRSESMQSNQMKTAEIMDVNADAIIEAVQEAGVDLMIHGHTHKPAVHQYDGFKRVVLGDWGATGWFIEINSIEGMLVEFDLQDPNRRLNYIDF